MSKPASDRIVDGIERNLDTWGDANGIDIRSLIARIRQQDAEIERLRAPLKPFSIFAGPLFERNFNASDVVDRVSAADGSVIELKAGAFFKARAALQGGSGRKFKLGDRVTKVKGSQWTGRVVGFYSTELTPVGYAVESETERGSVQIYPEAALKGREA